MHRGALFDQLKVEGMYACPQGYKRRDPQLTGVLR